MNINLQGKHGNTALHYAVREQKVEFIQSLIRAGIDITIKNNSNKIAAHYAKSKKVQLLLNNCIKIN